MKVNIEVEEEDLETLFMKIKYVVSLKQQGQELLAGYELSKLETLIYDFYRKTRVQKAHIEEGFTAAYQYES